MSAHILCTGVLSSPPERVPPVRDRQRPLYRGTLVFETGSGAWWPAGYSTWSRTVADTLAGLEKGDAIAVQARLNLGSYTREDGKPGVRVSLQIEQLLALPKPARSRPSLPPDDARLADSKQQQSEAGRAH